MILDLVLWSGVFGSGYAVFKRQDKLFERRVLKEQKRRTSVLKARLLGEQAQREQDHSDAKAGPEASPDMKEGILIKDGRSLELLGKVDTIVFDKTGTLTEETPGIGTIHVLAQGSSADDILALAAAAEHRQTNPLARAILGAGANGARARAERIPPWLWCVGAARGRDRDHRQRPLHGGGGHCPAGGSPPGSGAVQGAGHGVLLVARGGAIELQPALRPEASATIAALRALPGIREIRILSGDRERPPRALAEKLGMDAHDAQVLPKQKAALIERLQQEGRLVCFVGDGVNDAIAHETGAGLRLAAGRVATGQRHSADCADEQGHKTHAPPLRPLRRLQAPHE